MRENLVGHIVGAKEVIAPVWQSTHLFRRHIRIMQSPRGGGGERSPVQLLDTTPRSSISRNS
jgi:hypothetical protein